MSLLLSPIDLLYIGILGLVPCSIIFHLKASQFLFSLHFCPLDSLLDAR